MGSPYQKPLLVMLGGVPFALLARLWWLSERYDDEFQRLLWATTLSWIPVLNLYVGIYDSILIVQSALITAWVVCRRSQTLTPLTNSGLAYVLLAIYVSPWFSQNLAKATGIPLYTLVLIGLGTLQLRYLYGFEMERQDYPPAAQ
jgi:hypothetical protein